MIQQKDQPRLYRRGNTLCEIFEWFYVGLLLLRPDGADTSSGHFSVFSEVVATSLAKWDAFSCAGIKSIPSNIEIGEYDCESIGSCLSLRVPIDEDT